jgi:SAM-dependent methyltransferase
VLVPSTIRQRALRTLRPLLGAVELNHLARLLPVAALVREAGGDELLDVGSGSRGLARWVPPGVAVTALDTTFDDYGAAGRFVGAGARPVVGSVLAMPFEDRAFHTVAAIDLLEHLAPADRPRALDELVRVTRGRLIVACPVGAEALAADARLARALERRRAPVPGWLEEHLRNGFPERAEIADRLAPHGRLRVIANLALSRHERLVRAELSVPAYLPTRLAAAALGRAARGGRAPGRAAAWALAALRGDDRPPTYRLVFCLDVAS